MNKFSTFYFELPLLSPTEADVPKPTLFPPSLPVTTNDAHNNRIDDLHVYSTRQLPLECHLCVIFKDLIASWGKLPAN